MFFSMFPGDNDPTNSYLAGRVANFNTLYRWKKWALLDEDGTPPLSWAATCGQHGLIHYLYSIKLDIGPNLSYLGDDDMSLYLA